MSTKNTKPLARRSEVENFLAKVKSTPPSVVHGKGRLLFGLDATMSRQPLWDQASQLHAEMFLASTKSAELQVQLAYFRGLMDFQHSAWVEDPKRLIQVMTGIHCQAGRTQISRLLHHILNESRQHKVNAAIYVGDAVEEGEGSLYKLAGQLGLLKTPLFVFQEGYDPEVQQVFAKVARLSGGAWCRFDEGSVEQLRALLGAVTRFAKGGYRALSYYASEHQGSARGRKALDIIKQLPAPGDSS